jgi:hypothetical protein
MQMTSESKLFHDFALNAAGGVILILNPRPPLGTGGRFRETVEYFRILKNWREDGSRQWWDNRKIYVFDFGFDSLSHLHANRMAIRLSVQFSIRFHVGIPVQAQIGGRGILVSRNLQSVVKIKIFILPTCMEIVDGIVQWNVHSIMHTHIHFTIFFSLFSLSPFWTDAATAQWKAELAALLATASTTASVETSWVLKRRVAFSSSVFWKWEIWEISAREKWSR